MGTQIHHHTIAKSEVFAMVSFGHKEREGEKNTNVFVFAYSGMVDAANALASDIKVEWHGAPVMEMCLKREPSQKQDDD